MSAAAVNDVAAWTLLALAIAVSDKSQSALVALWMARQCPEGEPLEETYICAALAMVLAAGFITDAIGIHAMFGAFVVGVLIPKDGPLTSALVEKVEDLVSGLFLPLYFVSSGLKTNVATIQGLQSWGLLVLVIVTACLGKIARTVSVPHFCKLPWNESLVLGFLMSSKGLVELIGLDRKVLNYQTFAIMTYQQLSQVSVRSMTAISSMANIHEDIRATTEEKRVTVIILPFHKHQRTLDGSLETTHSDFRLVNKRVLDNVPCSIGIFVDRGLGGACHVSASNVSYGVTVLFFGGGDDREALAYGRLMAEHPGIRLAVVHFVSEAILEEEIVRVDVDDHSGTKEFTEDEESVNALKQKNPNDGSINYTEKIVKE
ncbi:hypothetical protein K1719_002820 [Acacia pycnantha]|nr:hypothetical protein K1719_002820 [Acacia pycnantha]